LTSRFFLFLLCPRLFQGFGGHKTSGFAAIIYVLRMSIQWNALPGGLGVSSTVHDRFQEWEQAGAFKIFRHGFGFRSNVDETTKIKNMNHKM
jgi:transposase